MSVIHVGAPVTRKAIQDFVTELGHELTVDVIKNHFELFNDYNPADLDLDDADDMEIGDAKQFDNYTRVEVSIVAHSNFGNSVYLAACFPDDVNTEDMQSDWKVWVPIVSWVNRFDNKKISAVNWDKVRKMFLNELADKLRTDRGDTDWGHQ